MSDKDYLLTIVFAKIRTFHTCSKTWKYDLKNINQTKSQIFFFTKVRTSAFVFYDWCSQFSRMPPPLIQDNVIAYAEKWSSKGKN